MSSWDRARYIPWSHLSQIPDDGKNIDAHKERIFRKLQRETQQDELKMQERNPAIPKVDGGEPVGKDAVSQQLKVKVPYSNMELLRQGMYVPLGSTVFGLFCFSSSKLLYTADWWIFDILYQRIGCFCVVNFRLLITCSLPHYIHSLILICTVGAAGATIGSITGCVFVSF